MSTNQDIAQHNRRWSDLPEFPQWPHGMDDDDVAAWSDILHLRVLAEQIEDALASPQAARGILARGLVEFDIDLYLEPWPDADPAADMIALWRAHPEPGTIRVPIDTIR